MEYIQLQEPGRRSERSGTFGGFGETLETVATWSVDNAVVIGAVVAGVIAAVILWRMLTRSSMSKL